MTDGQQAEIVESIGEVLLDLLPDDAVAITAKMRADEGYSSASLFVRQADGATLPFGGGPEFDDPVDDICESLLQLWSLMVEDTGHGFYGATITVDRNGQFNVDFSYDPPED